jgi:transposase-like protein
MFDAIPPALIPARKRGPKGKFSDTRKALELVAYLAEPDSSLAGAAKKFECSQSLIEKTIARLRAGGKQTEAPTSDQVRGDVTSEAGAPCAAQVHDTPGLPDQA